MSGVAVDCLTAAQATSATASTIRVVAPLPVLPNSKQGVKEHRRIGAHGTRWMPRVPMRRFRALVFRIAEDATAYELLNNETWTPPMHRVDVYQHQYSRNQPWQDLRCRSAIQWMMMSRMTDVSHHQETLLLASHSKHSQTTSPWQVPPYHVRSQTIAAHLASVIKDNTFCLTPYRYNSAATVYVPTIEPHIQLTTIT